jgi:hypothetical protein
MKKFLVYVDCISLLQEIILEMKVCSIICATDELKKLEIWFEIHKNLNDSCLDLKIKHWKVSQI